MIEVVNIRDVKVWDASYVYVGRKNVRFGVSESVLANPFVIGKDGDRDEVILKYRYWLWQRVKEEGEVYAHLLDLVERVRAGEELKLVCWCKPKGCHGDVVKRCLEWMLG